MVIERIVLLEAQNVHSSTAIKVVALERETRDSGDVKSDKMTACSKYRGQHLDRYKPVRKGSCGSTKSDFLQDKNCDVLLPPFRVFWTKEDNADQVKTIGER